MLRFTYQSGIYTLTSSMMVNTGLQTLWDFISKPENLTKITPPDMNFRITFRSSLPGKNMYSGQIITYNVKPLPFLDSSWVTEITKVEDKKYFIDEQRFGPYKFWHHQHMIRETDHGIEMTDIVSYKLPMGFAGRWLAGRMVRNQLRKIFDFRKQQMEKYFPDRVIPGSQA